MVLGNRAVAAGIVFKFLNIFKSLGRMVSVRRAYRLKKLSFGVPRGFFFWTRAP